MATKISKEDVIDFFKGGGKVLYNLAIKIYGESLDQAVENAFSEAMEIGIGNTFAALYDANVRDEEILRVVYEHWGMPKQEAEDRLIFEKQQALIRKLKLYLKLQGYTEKEIKTFLVEHKVSIKIRNNKELLKFKHCPDKLFKAVQDQK